MKLTTEQVLQKNDRRALVAKLENGLRALTSMLGTVAEGSTLHKGMSLEDLRETLNYLDANLTDRAVA